MWQCKRAKSYRLQHSHISTLCEVICQTDIIFHDPQISVSVKPKSNVTLEIPAKWFIYSFSFLNWLLDTPIYRIEVTEAYCRKIVLAHFYLVNLHNVRGYCVCLRNCIIHEDVSMSAIYWWLCRIETEETILESSRRCLWKRGYKVT